MPRSIQDTQVVDRSDSWTATALAMVLFCIYTLGACRTIYVGDSGELVAAAHVLGIPHPSGYPLYVMLGKLWTLLVPLGSVAFRMSLFSAACASVACSVLFLVARRLECDRLSALLAALLLAFGPSFWGEANIQRVYALNALFVSVATLSALEWDRSRRRRDLVATVFVCGLGATNHSFMGIYGVAFGVYALITDRRSVLRFGTLAAVVVAGLIGLLPYSYLPIASSFDPPLDWGNPETWSSFLAVVRREGFWQRAWIESPLDLVVITGDYLAGIARELAWVGLPLVAVGVAARRRGTLLFLLVMLLNLLVMASHGSRSDLFIWHRYYIPSYAMTALLAAIGASYVSRRFFRWSSALALIIPLVLLVTGWQRFDRSDYRIADDFSRSLLATIPPGSSLSATDDNILFVLIYLTMVEGVRPDINLVLQGVGGEKPNLRFDPETEPLYFTHHPNWNHPQLDIVPVGLAFRVWRRGEPLPELKQPPEELRSAADESVPRDYLTQNLVGHYYFMLGFTAERTHWPRAKDLLERALREAPTNDVLFYNVGLIYQRNDLLHDALRVFRRSHEINPRHIASSSKARASAKIAEVEAAIRSSR